MVFQDKWIRIPYDGTSVSFDLINGAKVQNQEQSSDIRVTLTRTPINIIRGRQKFDWHATIEAIDGGLIEAEGDFMYLAPEQGYKPRIEIQVNANDPKWSADRKISFFIHNRAGRQYGRITLEFNTGSDQPTTGFGFVSYINPSGSRVLEYDPFKRIIPGKKKAQ